MTSEPFSAGGPFAHQDPDLSAEEQALALRLVALRDLEPSEAYRQRAAAQIRQHIARKPPRASAPADGFCGPGQRAAARHWRYGSPWCFA